MEIDTNISEQEFVKATSRLIRAIEKETTAISNSISKKIVKLGKEYKELIKEIQSSGDYESAEQLKKVFEETIAQYSEKYANPVEIEFLRSILPENFYIANNKLANEITKDFVDKGEITLAVIMSPKKGDIVTYNSLTYDDENITISGSREFTAYDRAIHNSVCSLYVAGNELITPIMVYRAMNGMSETDHIDPSTLGAVSTSLDKSRSLRLKVDFTDEAKARGLNVDEMTIDSHLLNATKVKIKAGREVTEGYRILDTPVLYKYAQYTKQILAVSAKLLDTKEATRNTDKIIPIKEYLLRRIEIMKHDKDMSNKILYDTIFEEAGITTTSRVQNQRLREYVKEILSLWKMRDNYITDFSECQEKKKITGIEIIC